MKLKALTRTTEKKKDAKRLRRAGQIPAIIYSQGNPGEAVSVDDHEFLTLLRGIEKGSLPSTVLTLTDEAGKERSVICKGIEYHPTTYKILHLDFQELKKDAKVCFKVPLSFTGEADCIGIKQGGFLRQVIRHVPVECLPKDMPTQFVLDVRQLEITHTKRLKDIAWPKGVRPLMPVEEVAVVIAKR